jgi:hypothetical protein
VALELRSAGWERARAIAGGFDALRAGAFETTRIDRSG